VDGEAADADGYEGGQGQVVRVVNASGTAVARKRVLHGALGSDRLEELHGALTRRRHPSLVRQRAVERCDDAVYVTSDWVDGETLAAWAPEASVDGLVDRVRQVAEALDVLHADLDPDGPLLHRDVKPSNVVVTPDGRAVLIDPGLARLGPSLATGSPYGTPGYVPPECIADPTAGSPAADRWQLAATLVAALVGQPPSWEADASTLRQSLVERVRDEVDDPVGFADAVLAMLAPDPADRPAGAAPWVASLRAAVGSASGRSGRARPRGVLVAGGVGAALLVLAAGVALGRATGEGTDAPVDDETEIADDGHTALIDTRTTSGPHVDQQYQAYLSTETVSRCRALGCAVAGSTLVTGDRVTLTCRARGARVTNGNDASPLDDANPLRYESNWWFGAVDAAGRWGFVSAVWVHPDDRAAALPFC
jgi:hypothetical protein